MRKFILLPLALFALLFAGCGNESTTYQIIIQDKTITLPIRKSPEQLRKDIRPILKPHWDNLVVGESPVFYYKRINSGLFTSPPFRFFKKKNGKMGMEQLEGNKTEELIIGKGIKWDDVEEYLAKQVLYHYNKIPL